MKCPKCHKEVEKGSLYCPYCLAEIPWVREFSTVETLMKKEQQNRPSEKKQKTEIIKYFKHPKRRKLKFSRKQLLCLLLCAATLLGFFCYRQLNTFSALYSRAKKQYAQQNYEEAQRIAENALDKNPKNEAANLLLAKSMEKSGDKRSALLVLRPFIQNKTAGTGYYYADVDTPEKNWRMIFLNTSDKPYYLKNGQYTHGWCSEFSEEQTLWLERDALVTDRDIIVFSHQPLHNEGIFGTEGMPDAVKPYDDLRGGPRVYYDVKKCRNVKMLVAGHVHFDNMLYDDRILSVTSLCSLVQEWSPNCPERVCGTPSETAFDVFSIKGDKVQITRFGAGNDRVGVLLRT